jgi:FkbH-like protein
MEDIKYSEILRINNNFSKELPDKKYRIKVLSNINTSQLNEILEYGLRMNSIPAISESGDYDNIVQDSLKYGNLDLIIIFWELCNIFDGFQFKSELLSDYQLERVVKKITLDIDFVFRNVQNTSLVFVNKFTSLSFSSANIKNSNFDKLASRLNKVLIKRATSNIKLIDLEKVLINIGVNKALDLRYYYSSKALYTVSFFKKYVEFIRPFIVSANGLSKKAIIFDCDNTIWGGILGEDGFNGISMSTRTPSGSIFSEIQAIALSLRKQGVLIGLCSKNNYGDVIDVMRNHPDMQLKERHVSIMKINWEDKVTNLKEIAKDLSIGLDSMVFIDDSPFEVNLIKQKIPEVTVFQVPENIYEYPKMLSTSTNLFYSLSNTHEDMSRVDMYKQKEKREVFKNSFSDIEDYLSSLKLEINFHEKLLDIIPRLSQITQKTNQFNLITRRYTEKDIESLIHDRSVKIFAFSVKDKFGDNGITGLCIVKNIKEKKVAKIDTLLMSCRIIGRNIEYAFFDALINALKKDKITTVTAKYIKSFKNKQVSHFYDNCSFSVIDSNDYETSYNLNVSDYKEKNLSYIKVLNVK